MSNVYQCIECEQHYCSTCEGGVDHCEECLRGPLCDECAAENHSGMKHVCETRGYEHGICDSCGCANYKCKGCGLITCQHPCTYCNRKEQPDG